MFTSALNIFKNLGQKLASSTPSTDAAQSRTKDIVVSDDKQARYNPYKSDSANENRVDGAGAIRIGMTTQQLVQSIGPALTKQYDGNREIWTYLNLRSSGVRTHIAIQNGIVLNWQDVYPQGDRRFVGK